MNEPLFRFNGKRWEISKDNGKTWALAKDYYYDNIEEVSEKKKFTESKMKEIDLAEYEDDEIKLLVGSHHRIIISKLYGPTAAKDLKIVWEGDDWNVRNKIKLLKNKKPK